MRTVVLTELGISVYEDDVHSYTVPFTNPSTQYVAVKHKESIPDGLVERLQKEETGFMCTDASLMALLKKESLDAQMAPEEYVQKIQTQKPKILVDSGLAENENDASEKLRDFAMSLSSSRVTEISSSPDLHVIQSINTLDEVDRVCNALSSRLREWYGLHFPELDNIVDGIAGYSKIVTSGRRDDLDEGAFAEAGFPESKVKMLKVVREKSRGGEITDENLAVVKSLAQRMLDMMDLRKNLEEHLEKEMERVAPNLAVILGTGVAARMLARAGSLKKLASLPASTIQVLGAERALFRSLKTGAPPPKHGLLFQHALVHAAPRWQRGKIARAVAAKAVIAARVDVYGNGINNTLMEKLNTRITEISTKYEDAPKQRPDADRFKKDREDSGEKRTFGKDRRKRDSAEGGAKKPWADKPKERGGFGEQRDDRRKDFSGNRNGGGRRFDGRREGGRGDFDGRKRSYGGNRSDYRRDGDRKNFSDDRKRSYGGNRSDDRSDGDRKNFSDDRGRSYSGRKFDGRRDDRRKDFSGNRDGGGRRFDGRREGGRGDFDDRKRSYGGNRYDDRRKDFSGNRDGGGRRFDGRREGGRRDFSDEHQRPYGKRRFDRRQDDTRSGFSDEGSRSGNGFENRYGESRADDGYGGREKYRGRGADRSNDGFGRGSGSSKGGYARRSADRSSSDRPQRFGDGKKRGSEKPRKRFDKR